jgi:hypothetical protein
MHYIRNREEDKKKLPSDDPSHIEGKSATAVSRKQAVGTLPE